MIVHSRCNKSQLLQTIIVILLFTANFYCFNNCLMTPSFSTDVRCHEGHYRLLSYTKILEVNLFAFAYRLFHEDFSSVDGATFLCWKHQIRQRFNKILITSIRSLTIADQILLYIFGSSTT